MPPCGPSPPPAPHRIGKELPQLLSHIFGWESTVSQLLEGRGVEPFMPKPRNLKVGLRKVPISLDIFREAPWRAATLGSPFLGHWPGVRQEHLQILPLPTWLGLQSLGCRVERRELQGFNIWGIGLEVR